MVTLIVNLAVKFNNEAGALASEIRHVAINGMLALELQARETTAAK